MRHDTSRFLSAALVTALAASGLAAGCDSPEDAEPPAARAAAQAPDEAEAPAESDRYAVVSPKAPVAVGAPATAELAFTPGAGLKINHEFPWRLAIEPNEALGVEARTLTKDDFELANKKAALTVDLAPTAPGEHTLSGTADLSVCTETQCYVMRQQKVAFAVAAQPGVDQPGTVDPNAPE